MRRVAKPEARLGRTRLLCVLAAVVVLLGVVTSSNRSAVLASPVAGKATVQTISLPPSTTPPITASSADPSRPQLIQSGRSGAADVWSRSVRTGFL